MQSPPESPSGTPSTVMHGFPPYYFEEEPQEKLPEPADSSEKETRAVKKISKNGEIARFVIPPFKKQQSGLQLPITPKTKGQTILKYGFPNIGKPDLVAGRIIIDMQYDRYLKLWVDVIKQPLSTQDVVGFLELVRNSAIEKSYSLPIPRKRVEFLSLQALHFEAESRKELSKSTEEPLLSISKKKAYRSADSKVSAEGIIRDKYLQRYLVELSKLKKALAINLEDETNARKKIKKLRDLFQDDQLLKGYFLGEDIETEKEPESKSKEIVKEVEDHGQVQKSLNALAKNLHTNNVKNIQRHALYLSGKIPDIDMTSVEYRVKKLLASKLPFEEEDVRHVVQQADYLHKYLIDSRKLKKALSINSDDVEETKKKIKQLKRLLPSEEQSAIYFNGELTEKEYATSVRKNTDKTSEEFLQEVEAYNKQKLEEVRQTLQTLKEIILSKDKDYKKIGEKANILCQKIPCRIYPVAFKAKIKYEPCIFEAYSEDQILVHFSGITVKHNKKKIEDGASKQVYFAWSVLPVVKQLAYAVSKKAPPVLIEDLPELPSFNFSNEPVGPKFHLKKSFSARKTSVETEILIPRSKSGTKEDIVDEDAASVEDILYAQKNEERCIQRLIQDQERTHPNIVKVYKLFYWENGQQIIVMKYYPVNLRDKLERIWTQKAALLSDGEKLQLAIDIASGVAFMHKNRIAHRDLKLENILLGKGGKAVLTDFGFSSDDTTQIGRLRMLDKLGTPRYYPPEFLTGYQGDAFAADIWALANIFWMIFTDELFPWFDYLDDNQIQDKEALRSMNEFFLGGPYQDCFLKNLVWRMWNIETIKRPSAKEVLKSLRSYQKLIGLKDDETQSYNFRTFFYPHTLLDKVFHGHENKKYFPDRLKLNYAIEISRLFADLHAQGKTSHQFTMENLLVNGGEFVIVDSEYHHKKVGKPTECLRIPGYFSLEALQGIHEDPFRAELWSLGCVLWVMLTGTAVPWFTYLTKEGLNVRAAVNEIKKFIDQGPYKDNFFKDLFWRIFNPDCQINANEIVESLEEFAASTNKLASFFKYQPIKHRKIEGQILRKTHQFKISQADWDLFISSYNGSLQDELPPLEDDDDLPPWIDQAATVTNSASPSPSSGSKSGVSKSGKRIRSSSKLTTIIEEEEPENKNKDPGKEKEDKGN